MQSAPFAQHALKGLGGSADVPENVINNFQDIEDFLENVLVQNPVSIDAELVPAVLSRGLGLSCDSSFSLGQQGSNDRRQASGKPWSSVSNGGQGNTTTNNGNGTAADGSVPKQLRTSDAPTGEANEQEARDKRVHDKSAAIPSAKNVVQGNCVDQVSAKEDGDASREKSRAAVTDGGPNNRKKQKQSNVDHHAGDAHRKHSHKRTHSHKDKERQQMQDNQKQMQWNQEHLQQQIQKQFQQQQQMQQQIQQMQQQSQQAAMAAAFGGSGAFVGNNTSGNGNNAGQPMPFPAMAPGYLFPGQQPTFSPVPYPFQFAAPDGRRLAFYPGMNCRDFSENFEDQPGKRTRLIWTEELHKIFLKSVDRCGGIDHALPKAIMKDMKVDGLTRENVSSHLQKYRLRLKKAQLGDDETDKDVSQSK